MFTISGVSPEGPTTTRHEAANDALRTFHDQQANHVRDLTIMDCDGKMLTEQRLAMLVMKERLGE